MSKENTLQHQYKNPSRSLGKHDKAGPNRRAQWKGRLTLLVLILFFTLPFIFAKTILSNHWYQSGVTNHGVLVEPRMTFEDLGLNNPLQRDTWQLGYVLPSVCQVECQNRLYVLGQTYIALGRHQERVTPVVYVLPGQTLPELPDSVMLIEVNPQFVSVVPEEGYVIVDTLGQLVMSFEASNAENEASHSKGLLTDFRKLLKLSRVG
ncbi:hypothetical protein [Vibrio methylphosphonaticus]|uniref:hypothetical protein n=1 Tax=Vibrio methylphosphonaticus TaxID=2946866 RepID=UPI00202ABAC6|nr:hypothetical protein [Vibrio methylphosphonaticus]MCL9773688.1 hypothetical protein [Vibrio methylphosphonaticus]